MGNLKNIPELRFPEFKGEWKIKKFGELTERISNPVKVELEKMYQQIGIRSHGKGIFHKEFVDGKTLGNKRVFWVKEDVLIVNIVFAWEQAVAKTTKNEIGMIASHRFPMYLPIKTQSDLNYLLYFFLTKRGKSLLELASPGGAGRNKTLGQKEFENLKFLIPEVAEQNKIALFLSAIESKLNALKQKKNLLELYKKGVMQKLFSQELRFKNSEGKEFPKWEKKKLGELNLYISDGNYGELYPKASEMKESGIPFIRANNIKNLSLVWNEMRFIEEEHHKILTSGHLWLYSKIYMK
jgi:type I restriction enzyme S subunit